jgi:hypothetical protein
LFKKKFVQITRQTDAHVENIRETISVTFTCPFLTHFTAFAGFQHQTEIKMRRSFLFATGLAVLLALSIETAVGQPGVIAAATVDATELATLLLNPTESGVEILNAELKGNAAQHGVYAQVGGLFKGLPSTGIVLSSGKVEEVKFGVINPNTVFDGSGDSDLDSVLKTINQAYSSLDAAVLSIQVKVPRSVTIKVSYVFGSDDFFDSEFNPPPTFYPDIFGLFLNNKNVALIGGKSVSVATIYCANGGSNCNQRISNYDPIQDIAVAGTSLEFYTKTQVVMLDLPMGTHQLKVAVADGTNDGTNRLSDAAVFLSFIGAVKAQTAAPVSPPVAVPVGKMKMAMMMMTMN